jgi:hypothetical protein
MWYLLIVIASFIILELLYLNLINDETYGPYDKFNFNKKRLKDLDSDEHVLLLLTAIFWLPILLTIISIIIYDRCKTS